MHYENGNRKKQKNFFIKGDTWKWSVNITLPPPQKKKHCKEGKKKQSQNPYETQKTLKLGVFETNVRENEKRGYD